jgi:phosphoenolpyruvate-protein kinase (PTS system EI component)
MTPAAIPVVKRGLRAVDSRQAETIARRALRAAAAEDVHRLLAPLADAMHAAVAIGETTQGRR